MLLVNLNPVAVTFEHKNPVLIIHVYPYWPPETYGLAKEGARHHGYTGKRGYHPLLAIAAGTGDVLMSRLREGRANTARGAAHFLRETVGRVRYAGANGRLTLRADSGF